MEATNNHNPDFKILEQGKGTKKSINKFSEVIDLQMQDITKKEQNPFPINAFPSLFKNLIVDLNKSLSYPIDYTGTAILTAIATTIGTSAKIQVKYGWYEYASIYGGIIGNAGANKTHPINTIFSVIRDIDKMNHDTFENQYREYNEYQKLSKTEKLEATKVYLPKLTKSILTNFTPEVLNKRLNENLRGCTVVSDEMATFFEGMNNYSKGDQIGVYLSFWSNQPTTIDRIGDPIPLFIKNPYLSIIGGLQPRMLASVFPIQKLNNGFFQRFLFAFPDGTMKQPINDNDFNQSIFNKYKRFIDDYYKTSTVIEEDGFINSKILSWKPDAKAFFYNWQKENCDLVNEYSNNIKGEIISKFDNHFIRLSLLLQIMENPKSDFIEIKAVESAKLLCEYYMNCSFKILEVIQNPIEYLNTFPDNKKRFYSSLNNEFTTAEATAKGKDYDLQERRVKEFLKDNILFKRIKHGFYEKTLSKQSEL